MLSPAVGLTLYRVTQEALTNAQRYGDGRVRLTLTREIGSLAMTVTNLRSSDPNRSPGRPGYGLLGMRERATAVGGTLQLDTDAETFNLSVTPPTNEASRR